MIDYVQLYIDKVESGQIIVGKKIQQAIDRHKSDIERSKTDDFEYYYDTSEAIEAINFISSLPDPLTGKPNDLASFQGFILGMIYGWRKKKNNTRRFNKAYISVARKNGKSLLVSGIALYDLILGDNPAASRQIYSAANTRDQAKIVFNMVKNQLKALRRVSPSVKKFTKINKYEVECDDESFMKPLASDSSTLDGLNCMTFIADEIAEAKDFSVIDVLQTSMAQQENGIGILISTASTNLNGPMFQEEYPFITRLLNKEAEADTYLALCWEQDSLDEVDNKDLWQKSNPLFELDAVKDKMLSHKKSVEQESRIKSNMTNFLTKELNFFVQSSKDSYITKEEWEVLKADKEYNIRGRKVYIGLDLSRTDDITAVSWVIPIEEECKFLIDTHGFVSSKGGIDRKIQNDKIPYRQYENMGLIDISTLETGLVDIKFMVDWLVNFVYEYDLDVIGVYYDPVMINTVLSDLNNTFYEKLIEVPQRINYLSAPTRTLREMIRKGDIIHTGNPLLTRAMYNAVLKETNDAIMIDKSMNRNKIDPVDAVINAMYDGQFHDFNSSSAQELYDNGQYGFGV